jgi:hypothetical protein
VSDAAVAVAGEIVNVVTLASPCTASVTATHARFVVPPVENVGGSSDEAVRSLLAVAMTRLADDVSDELTQIRLV